MMCACVSCYFYVAPGELVTHADALLSDPDAVSLVCGVLAKGYKRVSGVVVWYYPLRCINLLHTLCA